jgi:proteasome lid subunit RPN8/RPN11
MSVRSWLTEKVRNFLGLQQIREVTISASVLLDLSDMARSAHPKEVLAFFSASNGIKKGVLQIDELQLQAYYANEDSASVVLSNLPMTTTIVGTAHSHPGGGKIPSRADLQLYSKFGIVHAIIGEPYRVSDVRFYTKDGRPLPVRVVH